jgi:hypothetical protein
MSIPECTFAAVSAAYPSKGMQNCTTVYVVRYAGQKDGMILSYCYIRSSLLRVVSEDTAMFFLSL